MQIQQIQREREVEVLALAYETNTAVQGKPLILVKWPLPCTGARCVGHVVGS